MSIVPQNPTYAYVGAFVDELARAGVSHVVICPGSRSTPLTLTFAAEERIKKWVLVDERSAAFFALGIAKRSRQPVALVCTSGTAAANFFPAVCEAKEARVPLLVLTADRPPELQGVGAPQTMGQKYLYGEHVKWFTEMPLPEATNTVMRYARFTANRAVYTSIMMPSGPVHLNFPLREPLSNIEIQGQSLLTDNQQDKRAWGAGYRGGYTRVNHEPLTHQLETVYSGETVASHQRGLIVAGPNARVSREYVVELAKELGWVILADPLSGMRATPIPWDYELGEPLRSDGGANFIIENYDAILRDKTFFDTYKPDFVLRLGAMPTSKILTQYLQSAENCETWLIDEGMGWLDPTLTVDEIWSSDGNSIIGGLLHDMRALGTSPQPKGEWYHAWQLACEYTRKTIACEIEGFTDLFEGNVFPEIEDLLPLRASMMVGNSMPIRDCDTFLPLSAKGIRMYGNRGVNGIDGQVSTALGIAASQNDEPTVLVVGDLTFYHDLNGLLAAKKYRLNLTVVVINNDGGGIFSFLPQAEHAPANHFEEFFGTSTGLDFSHVTSMYGGTFTRIGNWQEFRAAITKGISEGGLHVVEVPTDRQKNVEMHRHLWKKVSEALAVDSN